MTQNQTSRRSFVSTLTGCVVGLISATTGAALAVMGDRAKAESPRVTKMKKLVVPIKPVLDPAGWEYSVTWCDPGRNTGGSYGPTQVFQFAIEQCDVYRKMGCTAEIQRRPVGAWEIMQLPKTPEECRRG